MKEFNMAIYNKNNLFIDKNIKIQLIKYIGILIRKHNKKMANKCFYYKKFNRFINLKVTIISGKKIVKLLIKIDTKKGDCYVSQRLQKREGKS